MAYRVLTDLDSILDTRQGVLDVLLEEHKETFDRVYGDFYPKRILDKFDREPFNITSDSYLDAFEKRGIPAFIKARPTPLLRSMFRILIDAEALTGQPIRVENIEISIITHPYGLPNDILGQLKEILEGTLGYRCTVNFIDTKPEEVTGSFIANYTHVFMYHLFGASYPAFSKTFNERPNPDTRLFVPAVFLKEPDELGISPTAQWQRCSLLWATVFMVVPLPVKIFDCISKEEAAKMEENL